jgi:hypothetical protein
LSHHASPLEFSFDVSINLAIPFYASAMPFEDPRRHRVR